MKKILSGKGALERFTKECIKINR